jgi:hypothetical protein
VECHAGNLEDTAHRGKDLRRLDAPELLADVESGVNYVNGVRAVNRRGERVAA